MPNQLVQPPQARMHVTDAEGKPTNYLTRFHQQITAVLNGTTGVVAAGVSKITLGTGINHFAGVGSPESVVPANLGDLYSNTSGGSGTTLYVKTGGAPGTKTGWTAV